MGTIQHYLLVISFFANIEVGGGEEISWDEFRAEQFGFLEEPHITVGRVGFAQFGISIFFPFQDKMSKENLAAYKDLEER